MIASSFSEWVPEFGLAALVLLVYATLLLTNRTVPETLNNIALTVVAFYFGQRAGRAIQALKN